MAVTRQAHQVHGTCGQWQWGLGEEAIIASTNGPDSGSNREPPAPDNSLLYPADIFGLQPSACNPRPSGIQLT